MTDRKVEKQRHVIKCEHSVVISVRAHTLVPPKVIIIKIYVQRTWDSFMFIELGLVFLHECVNSGPCFGFTINSFPPSAAYMLQWIGSALVQIKACRLFGANPLSKPMLVYCHLIPYKYTPVKFQSRYKTFHWRKCIRRYRLRNGGHFVHGEMS